MNVINSHFLLKNSLLVTWPRELVLVEHVNHHIDKTFYIISAWERTTSADVRAGEH